MHAVLFQAIEDNEGGLDNFTKCGSVLAGYDGMAHINNGKAAAASLMGCSGLRHRNHDIALTSAGVACLPDIRCIASARALAYRVRRCACFFCASFPPCALPPAAYNRFGLNRGMHEGRQGIWYREWAPGAKVGLRQGRHAPVPSRGGYTWG